jgi:hypothetical protein
VTTPPFREGDFVWCAFPERETPARPGPLHLAYCLAITGASHNVAERGFTAIMAYTTSRPWPSPASPLGVFAFDKRQAAELGQTREFVMDLRRIAALPVTPTWFPRLHEGGRGIQGRMPKKRQLAYARIAGDLLTRRGELVERLGPDWPGRS